MAERGVKKRMSGTVIGNRMDKTAVVMVERMTKHRTYKKYVRRRAKYMIHDPNNACGLGDKVRIIECRPISKWKRWKLLEIMHKADIPT